MFLDTRWLYGLFPVDPSQADFPPEPPRSPCSLRCPVAWRSLYLWCISSPGRQSVDGSNSQGNRKNGLSLSLYLYTVYIYIYKNTYYIYIIIYIYMIMWFSMISILYDFLFFGRPWVLKQLDISVEIECVKNNQPDLVSALAATQS